MRVIIGNNAPADSNDVPIMIKLSQEDVQKIASKPESHDIVVFHPHHWPESNGRRWASAKVALMNKVDGRAVVTMESGDFETAEPQAEEIVQANSDSHPEPEAVEAVPVEETPPITSQKDETTVTDNDILSLLGIESEAESNGNRASVDLDASIS